MPADPAPAFTTEHRRRLERLEDPMSRSLGDATNRQAITAALARLDHLETEARRDYHADGTSELLASAEEVTRRRIEAAGRLAELDRLRDRVAAMEAPDPIACAELLGIDLQRRDVTVRHWAVSLMARSFAEFLGDAPNYRSIVIDVVHGEADDPERLRLEVVVRRAEGKTPSEVATERGAEIDQLRVERDALLAACRMLRSGLQGLIDDGGGHYCEEAARRDAAILDAAIAQAEAAAPAPEKGDRLGDLTALATRLRGMLPPTANVGPSAQGFARNWYGWCAGNKLAGVIDLIAEAFERQEPWTLPVAAPGPGEGPTDV